MNEYIRTPYAAMAALRVARAQLDAGDSKSARTTLTWVVEHGRDLGIQAVARIRLAGLLLDEGVADRAQLDAGLKLLEGPPPAEMAGAWIDRRADLLAELGRGGEARAAWTEALSKLDSNSPLRPLVQLKLDTFGAGS
jgi:predicted negative regulator of RcsB-dependent stress response